MAATSPPPSCEFCSKPASKRCGKCQRAKYCSVQCQQTAWPIHRVACGNTVKGKGTTQTNSSSFSSSASSSLFPHPPLLPLLPLWLGSKIPRSVHLFKSPVMVSLTWNRGSSRFGLDRGDLPNDSPNHHFCVACEKNVHLPFATRATLANRIESAPTTAPLTTNNSPPSNDDDEEGEPKKGVCGGCCSAVYCSEACQEVDWVLHQQVCAKFSAMGGVERAKAQYCGQPSEPTADTTPFDRMMRAVANKDPATVAQMIREETFAVDGSTTTPSSFTCCPFALAVDPEMRCMLVLRPLCSVWASHTGCLFCHSLQFICPVQLVQLEDVMGACRALFRRVLVREAAPTLLYDHVFGLVLQYLGQDAYFLMTT